MRIYVASSNPGKLRDFRYAAATTGSGVELLPLPGLKDIAAPPEDELTFAGNARVKALYYAGFAGGELVLADDSGLEVAALNGAPGVRSARYAEDLRFQSEREMTTDERNNAALLSALDAVQATDRSGRYRCALALAAGSEIVAVAEGSLEGTLLQQPRGEAWFVYDPLFLVTEAGVSEAGVPEDGMTMEELPPALRMDLSHRGRALRNLLRALA